MGEGKDNVCYPLNGNPNEARFWLSASTIKKAMAAGGSSAMLALLSTAVGNVSGPVQAALGVAIGTAMNQRNKKE